MIVMTAEEKQHGALVLLDLSVCFLIPAYRARRHCIASLNYSPVLFELLSSLLWTTLQSSLNIHYVVYSFLELGIHRIMVSFPGSQRITHWRLGHKEGSIVYRSSTGRVEVKRTGYYYIYSQMYYSDGSTAQMGHFTFINNDKVLESMGSVVSSVRKYNTKYHGGVFLLQETDTISIGIPYTKTYYMNSEGSFFGAFLLHPMWSDE